MKRTHTFTADDGAMFETAFECKRYEESLRLCNMLSGLSHAKIQTAFDRTDVELAHAFERAGAIISSARRESGELKRTREKAVI